MNFLKKFKDLLFESLIDNKKLIIVLAILFLICFAGAWILSEGPVSKSMSQIQNYSASNNPMEQGVSPVDLFINNEWGGIVTYIASIFFGIFAIFGIVYNGVNLGMVGQMFSQAIPNGGLRFIVYIIPHGIFEITATVIQSAAGVVLFLFIWRFIKAWRSSKKASDAFEQTKKILIQSIMLMIFATILLLIAAPIEAYVSVPLSDFIVGP